MKESTTYQAILQEGRHKGYLEGIRIGIVIVGESRFGPADDFVRESLKSIDNVEQLNTLLDRVLSANNWNDLLNDSSSN